MRKFKQISALFGLLLILSSCANSPKSSDFPDSGQNANSLKTADFGTFESNFDPSETLIYGSANKITRINPLLDEHGELNPLIFNGLTAHGKDNQIQPNLAKSWEYDSDSITFTFHLEESVKWHDGRPFTAEDVKFTIEAIKNPENQSENAPNFDEVEEIVVENDQTIIFRLSSPSAAFLDYMAIPILPKHLLEGENLEFSEFFTKNPIGTGPYKIAAWEDGQYLVLVQNDEYFKAPPQIPQIAVKFLPDDSSRFLQLKSGEIDLAQLPPKYAQSLEDNGGGGGNSSGKVEDFNVYHMKTADYRAIMFNFGNPYWQRNRDLIPALCYALDRQAMVDAILLGMGEPAYGPLQRNVYYNGQIQQYSYDPDRAKFLIEHIGFQKQDDGYYYRDGEKAAFTLTVPAGDQVRQALAQASAQNLQQIGVDVTVKIEQNIDFQNQMAYLVGWGSPFDADDHTYKIFASGQQANYSSYANPLVDKALGAARSTDDPALRRAAYDEFQRVLSADPPYAFLCYVDADYAATPALQGLDAGQLLGHHGVGIFWNVTDWTLER